MRAPFLSLASFSSKPSIRRHSSSENLFSDHHHLHPAQHENQILLFSPLLQSPSSKANSSIYTCVGFIIIFFVIMIATCLHCSSMDCIDSPQVVEDASLPQDTVTESEATMASPRKAIPALKGLGTVFIRGTKMMNELVVAHIAEDSQIKDLQLFLRMLYRSGVIARADTVLLFAWNTLPMPMVDVIHEEDCRFRGLLHAYTGGSTIANSSVSTARASSLNISISPLSIGAYRKASAENEVSAQQPFWGARPGNVWHDNRSGDATEQFVRGSVIGFDASELNPDDTLQGFFDHPPVLLRRWACYQMLLGMVRHRFKHVLLTEVSGVAILGDPFAVARRRGGLYLTLEDRPWGAAVDLGFHSRSAPNTSSSNRLTRRGSPRSRMFSSLSVSKTTAKKQSSAQADAHQRAAGGRRRARRGAPVGGPYERVYGTRMWSTLEDFERTKKLVNSAAIVGGIHQVRGLANTMVTEIVKVALDRMNRDAFPDNVLLSYLLHKSSSVLGKRVLDHLHLMDNAESFVHSLSGSQQPSVFFKRSSRAAYAMIQGNSKSKRWSTVAQAIRDDICRSRADAMAYGDCVHA